MENSIDKKILLALSDRDLMKAAARALIAKGYTVEAVNDGVQAVDAVEKSFFDLLIVGEGLSRIPVDKVVKDFRIKTHSPVICIFSSLFESDKLYTDNFGYCDFILTPFDRERLYSSVERAFEFSKKENAQFDDAILSYKRGRVLNDRGKQYICYAEIPFIEKILRKEDILFDGERSRRIIRALKEKFIKLGISIDVSDEV